MRVTVALFLQACAAAACVLATGTAYAGSTIEVTLDKAKVVKMPEAAQTIIIGNPIIADVTTLKGDRLVVVTGKGFGETNMIFLDKAGAAIDEATVHVTAGREQITVQRGLDRESYACHPTCEPTVALGDADAFLKGASGQIQSRNQLVTSITSH